MSRRVGRSYVDPGERFADRPKREKKLQEFVVWDGEGSTPEGQRNQNYILFGYFDGKSHDWINSPDLSTADCLALIIEAGKSHPKCIHVGFAFGYDTDMILRDLLPKEFQFLRERGYVRYMNYRIEHIPGKWLQITELGQSKKDRFTVGIFDIWGFFQASLVSALKSTVADHPKMVHLPEIEQGKDSRKQFTYEQLDFITKYWKIENELCHALITRLREYLYAVGLRINQWHGPGAIASYGYRTHNIEQHKADCGPAVYDAARFAYAGGRFERYHIGRYTKAYGYDINSAYPNAIAKLPSLSEGYWRHVKRPRRIVEFGVYRIAMRGPGITNRPAPFFHRDRAGNISYPWRLDGWYWSPEVTVAIQHLSHEKNIRILEGWEYVGWHTRPFEWVKEVYNQRRDMKAKGEGAQMALKLFLNSLYGKMAQRAGWERTGSAPHWHQLEWAGWVTSYTRAMLWDLMQRIPYDKLIAVETDGLYTTATPDEVGIKDSKELGGWEVSHYDELIYLQSGLYAKREGDEWSMKFRGLDKDSLTISNVLELTARLNSADTWPKLTGSTTRFVGYRNALFREKQNRGPFAYHHCVWETDTKEISCGSVGKRIHSPVMCKACQLGRDAMQMGHDTIIQSKTSLYTETVDLMSTRHDIPWLTVSQDAPDELFQWRIYEQQFEGLLPDL